MTDRETSHAEPDNEIDTILPGKSDEICDEDDENTGDFGTQTAANCVDQFATFVPADKSQINRIAIRYDALVRGDQIGDFRIQCLLGRGSFGAVYLARELTLDRLVAVKVVLPEGQHATKSEGRSLAQLKHPGIVGVYGEAHDPVSGCSLLWMQYVDGSNLDRLIKQLHVDQRDEWNESNLLCLLSPNTMSAPETAVPSASELDDLSRRSVETVCRIGVQLADALAHAHDSGITHRDIKPANILMQRDARPLLADFNLAGNESCIDRNAVSGGTIAYMPPERLAHLLGEDVQVDERRADVYSLGVVLWELACGSRPHTQAEEDLQSSGGQRLLDILRLRRQALPTTSKSLPIGLAMVLGRAICVDPEKRYPSAHAMATALSGLAQLESARRRAPTIGGIREFAQSHLLWIILIGGMLPHFAASGLQSAYNQIWIHVNDDAFFKAFIAYNIVVYPACVGWLAWNLFKFAQGYRRVVSRDADSARPIAQIASTIAEAAKAIHDRGRSRLVSWRRAVPLAAGPVWRDSQRESMVSLWDFVHDRRADCDDVLLRLRPVCGRLSRISRLLANRFTLPSPGPLRAFLDGESDQLGRDPGWRVTVGGSGPANGDRNPISPGNGLQLLGP